MARKRARQASSSGAEPKLGAACFTDVAYTFDAAGLNEASNRICLDGMAHAGEQVRRPSRGRAAAA